MVYAQEEDMTKEEGQQARVDSDSWPGKQEVGKPAHYYAATHNLHTVLYKLKASEQGNFHFLDNCCQSIACSMATLECNYQPVAV